MFLHQLLSEKNNLGQGNATSEPGTVRLRYKYRQNTGLSTKQGASSEPRARGVEFTDAAHFTGEDFESIHFSGDRVVFQAASEECLFPVVVIIRASPKVMNSLKK